MKVSVLVGPTRTGTTSIFRALSKGTKICGSQVKETDALLQSDIDQESYLSFFSMGQAEEILLEASPLYFTHPDKIYTAVSKMDLDFRFLITVREPIERYLSLINLIVLKRNFDKQFDANAYTEQLVQTALESNLTLPKNTLDRGILEGCYQHFIKQWFDYFGEDRVHVVSTQAILNSAPEIQNRLNIFLHGTGYDAEFTQENRSRNVKNVALHRIAMKTNDLIEPILNTSPALRDFLRNFYYGTNEQLNSERFLSDKSIDLISGFYSSQNANHIDDFDMVIDSELKELLARAYTAP